MLCLFYALQLVVPTLPYSHTFRVPFLPPLERYSPSPTSPLLFYHVGGGSSGGGSDSRGGAFAFKKNGRDQQREIRMQAEVVPGYVLSVLCKAELGAGGGGKDGKGGKGGSSSSSSSSSREELCIVTLTASTEGTYRRKASSDRDRVRELQDGALQWLGRDLERWCLENPQTEIEGDLPGGAPSTDQVEATRLVSELTSQLSDQGANLTDEPLEEMLEGVKKLNEEDEDALSRCFQSGLSFGTLKTPRSPSPSGSRSSANSSPSVAAAAGGAGGVDIFAPPPAMRDTEESSSWADFTSNVFWCASKLATFTPSPEPEVPSPSSTLPSSSDLICNPYDSPNSTYYSGSQPVPPEIVESLISIVDQGVQLGVIPDPRMQILFRVRWSGLIQRVQDEFADGATAKEVEVR